MKQRIDYFPDAEKMYDSAAKLICKSAEKAISYSESFVLVLAGGETPLALYRKLLNLPFPWDKTDFFWSDERCVNKLDSRSNYGNAMKAFLEQAPIVQENVHRIKTELSPELAAVSYAKELDEFKKRSGRKKLFDLVLLGMGEDGHTASLFPGSEALNETEKLVVEVRQQAVIPRVTLTYPAIADSEMVLFMIKGKKKKELLKSGKNIPAAVVNSKEIIWFAV
jgi:6-phosphogluconolactonase